MKAALMGFWLLPVALLEFVQFVRAMAPAVFDSFIVRNQAATAASLGALGGAANREAANELAEKIRAHYRLADKRPEPQKVVTFPNEILKP